MFFVGTQMTQIRRIYAYSFAIISQISIIRVLFIFYISII